MVVYHSRRVFFSIGTPLSAKKKLFADGGDQIKEKHVKGGGLLYDGYLKTLYPQIKNYLQILVFQ